MKGKELVWKIYKLTNPQNGKVYIGCTLKKLEFRWNQGKGYWYHEDLFPDIQEIGWDNFGKEILEYCSTEKEAQEAEKKWIKKFDSMNPEKGYNRTAGGKGMLDWHHTEESRAKIIESNHTRVLSEETKERMSLSHKGMYDKENNPFWGKKHTDETKKKLAEAATGRTHGPISEEHRQKLRDIHTGKPVVISEKTRKEHSERMKGHSVSEETREKIRKNTAGNKNPMYGKIPITATGVIQYDRNWNELARYPSASHAKRATGISNISIGACCKGQLKSAGGFYWKYNLDGNGNIVRPENDSIGNQPIIQFSLDLDYIKTFTNVYEVEKELHVNRHRIIRCCQGKSLSAYGFIWKFATESHM